MKGTGEGSAAAASPTGPEQLESHKNDLADWLRLLDAAARRVIPEHIARQLREMQRIARGETTAPSQSAITRESAGAETPADVEQPTRLAELVVVQYLLLPGEPTGIEQPTGLAKLTVRTARLRRRELADIEQPTILAEWVITAGSPAPDEADPDDGLA